MNNILSRYSKTTKWVILGLGLFLLSVIATFFLTKLFTGSSESTATGSPTSSTITSSELIKKFTDSYKLDGYTASSAISNSIISYKLSNSSYAVQVSALNSVQFERADNSNASDLDRATSNGTSYLTSYGFNKESKQTITNSTEITYDNQNNVCKLYNNFDPVKKSSKYGLTCTDKNLISAEYATIQSLLDIYQKSNGATAIKSVTRTTHSEANVSVSLLSVTPQDIKKNAFTLIFASIDNKRAYIGQRVNPSVDIKDSFRISSELKAVISDPKYNGLITKYVY